MVGGLVADGELVVSRGHRAVTLEAIDSALDHVALAVVGLVGLGRTTTAAPSFLRLRT
jgi:hypothetical protein